MSEAPPAPFSYVLWMWVESNCRWVSVEGTEGWGLVERGACKLQHSALQGMHAMWKCDSKQTNACVSLL